MMEKRKRSAKPVFYHMKGFMQKMEDTDESVDNLEKENWSIDWGSKSIGESQVNFKEI